MICSGIAERGASIDAIYKTNERNELQVVATGNTMTHCSTAA
jgi:hypothetical protein